MGKVKRAIGLMSGTSMDAIDVALIETDGEALVRPVHNASYPIKPKLRDLLVRAAKDARQLRVAGARHLRPGCMSDAEKETTLQHIDALRQFLDQHILRPDEIDIIGFHGQTVLHRPENALTIQLGDGAMLARNIGIDVIFDMRAADCAAGGQGAPLVPVYHRALARQLQADAGRSADPKRDQNQDQNQKMRLDEAVRAALAGPPRSLVFANIGGVANVTCLSRDHDLAAFDTGPGNGLLDDWIMQHTGKPIDVDGAISARGQVDFAVLAQLLDHDYFALSPPKSLDRNAFSLRAVAQLSLENGAATLCAFTAKSLARAQLFMQEPAALWIVCGGGRFNHAIMSGLKLEVACPVVSAEAAGLDGDALEAQAFAYLAVRAMHGDVLTFPATTGVSMPVSGGVLVPAKAP